MSRLRFQISTSLDGFAAGPDQSLENPIGLGGMRLHDWVFPLAAWRVMHGLEGGQTTASTPIIEEIQANMGAGIMGRNMFGGQPGPWDPAQPWNGWWDDDPPFHYPVFVLTHYPRVPLVLKGGTTFHFVTDGIEAALTQARQAAGERDISIAGGASTGRQFLAAGLVDEMWLHVVPILLGRGERLFDGGLDDLHGLKLVKTVQGDGVVHLKLVRP